MFSLSSFCLQIYNSFFIIEIMNCKIIKYLVIITIVSLYTENSGVSGKDEISMKCKNINKPKIFSRVDSSSTNFCKRFREVNANQNPVTVRCMFTKENNPELDKCKNLMKYHFTEIAEKSDNVVKMADFCINNQIRYEECKKIVDYFGELCYNMAETERLLQELKEIGYDYKNNYSLIKLNFNDLKLYKFAAINLVECLEEFSEQDSQTSIKVIDTYKKWYDINISDEVTMHCSCKTVYGINRIYEAREMQESLGIWYNTACLKNNVKIQKWSRHQFEGMAKSAKNLTLQEIVTFLFYETVIADAGWYTENKPKTEWNFGDLVNKIYSDKIDLTDMFRPDTKAIAAAIKFGFSESEFEKFSDLVYHHATECGENILKGLSESKEFLIKLWAEYKSSSLYNHDEYYCHNNEIINFDGSAINLFAELFLKRNSFYDNSPCEYFKQAVTNVQTKFFEFDFRMSSVNDLLSISVQGDITFEEFLNCFYYAVRFEELVLISKVTKTLDSLIQRDKIFEKFRLKLFQYRVNHQSPSCSDQDHYRIGDSKQKRIENMKFVLNFVFELGESEKFEDFDEFFSSLLTET